MYTRFSDELIEEVRINNDIVEVVSEYVRLEKKGKNYFGICPFHKEKTPSFSVEPGKQIFYCFGCGKGGNVIHFITLAENLDFIEAVRFLADRAKIVLPESNDEAQAEKARRKQLVLDINVIAARYYNDILNSKQGELAAAYLKKREISEKTARKFGLGYSPDDWDSLYLHLKSKGIAEEYMLESGLVMKSSRGKLYDRFRGRLMFPIFDVRGNVIGFGGRVLDDSLPKYVNSPETIVYSKGKHLYALNFAKNANNKTLIIVEGYMDAISLHQKGINNAVASLGTALTESQGRLLKKYAEEIIISYDADTAGQAATLRGLDLLNDMGCNVRVLTVPDGKDPDEYIRKNGRDSFQKLINSAMTLVDYKIGLLKERQDLSNLDGKISFLNKASSVISGIDNTIEREMYIKKLSREYGISEEAILTEVLKRTKTAAKKNLRIANKAETERKAAEKSDGPEEKILHNERFILSLLCVDNSIYSSVKVQLKIDMFSSEETRRLAAIILDRLENKKGFTPAELLNIVSAEESGEFARILNKECYCDDNRKAIVGKIKEIELLRAEKRQKEILELLKDQSKLPEGDVEKLKLELKNLLLTIRNIKQQV